jgi:hypothetical protein
MKLGLEVKAPEALGLVLPALKLDFETGDIKLRPKTELSEAPGEHRGDVGLLVRARLDGARGLPAPDDEEAERTQRGVLLACKAMVTRIDGVTLANREAFIADFRRLEELKIDKVRLVRQYQQKVEEFLAANKSSATHLVRQFLDAEERLTAFKKKNKLEREAILASEDAAGWILVAGVALFEFVVSLMLFAIALPGGVGEAFAFLLPVTFFNVVIGLAAGFYGTRNLHRQETWWRGLGVAILAFSFLVAFYVNLQVAQLRDVVSNAMGTNIFGALREVAEGPAAASLSAGLGDLPFGLKNLESLTFLLLGIVTWGFSVWKGVSGFDDVVPGFRNLTHLRNVARRDRELFFSLMRKWLQQENAELLRRLDAFQASIRSAIHEVEAQFRQHKQALIQATKAYEIVRDQTESEIKSYREVNRHVRRLRRFFFWKPVAPTPPAYFRDRIELPEPPTATYDSLETDLDAARARAEATIANLDDAISALSEEIGRSTERLSAFEAEVESLARGVTKVAAE